jgi:hypothetical protein
MLCDAARGAQQQPHGLWGLLSDEFGLFFLVILCGQEASRCDF